MASETDQPTTPGVPEPDSSNPEEYDIPDPENYTARTLPRRRKRDILRIFIGWVSIFCWGFFVAAMVFVDQATPEMQNMFSRHLELELREEWNIEAVANALQLMYYVAGLSFTVLVLKFIRSRRRKGDLVPYIFIILFLFSLLGIFMLQGKIPAP
jgi:hypothetical protein